MAAHLFAGKASDRPLVRSGGAAWLLLLVLLLLAGCRTDLRTELAEDDANEILDALYSAGIQGHKAAAGEKLFNQCKACHKVDGSDGVGPHLNGVVNRAKASVAGFGYSEALVAMAADAWTPENINGFLENPKGYAPGTKMSFAGLSKVEDRANVVAYLATLQ